MRGGRAPARRRPGGGAPKLPTDAQWAAMSPKAKEYVDKAKAIAGTDPDLVFDFGIFCKASGGSQNADRATIGVPEQRAEAAAVSRAQPGQVVGGQRLFDNFYWIGNTGIGAWLITSNDGYILFDTMNSEAGRARHHHPGDQEAQSRPDEDQVPGLRAQPFRSHRRRRIHPAAHRCESGHASRRLGALSEELRPRWRRRPWRPRRAARARAAARRAACSAAAEDEAGHRRDRRHDAHGRRRHRHDLHDDRPHARIDRHGRAGHVPEEPSTPFCSSPPAPTSTTAATSSAATSTSGTRPSR